MNLEPTTSREALGTTRIVATVKEGTSCVLYGLPYRNDGRSNFESEPRPRKLTTFPDFQHF